jgi:cobalt-zinc-cadmium efflux system protein
MSAAHAHSHGHGHDHGPSDTRGRAFAIGVGLNLGFVVLEVVFGVISHSMALVADAGHNLGDVLGLALAWGAAWLAQRTPSTRRTYGLRRTTILASLANAITLVLVTGGIAWESIQRLLHPTAIDGRIVILVALAGVLVNGVSALAFMRDRKRDLNVRSAFLHLASDAVLALGVAVAGGIFLFTGWLWLDPVVSLALSISILIGTWMLLRGSINLALDAVPEAINPEEVRRLLTSLPNVVEVHDLHIWAMSTTEIALTAHLRMTTGTPEPRFIGDVCKRLHDEFGIEHSTLQIEAAETAESCRQGPEGAL